MKKELRKRYLIKNTLIFTIGNFASKFISFILVPLYTNILTTSEYGIIDLMVVISTLIVPFITINIGEGIMRFMLDKNSDYNKIMSIEIVVLLFSTAISFLLIPIIKLIPQLNEYSLLFFIYMISFCFNQVLLMTLRGEEKLKEYAFGNILYTFFIAIFNIIFLVKFGMGIKGYFLAYISSNIIVILYSIYKTNILSVLKKFNFDKKLFIKMANYSIVLIPNSFMWWIMNSLDKVMVTGLISVAANGIYSISYKIPTLLSTFSTIFNQSWSYSAIKEKDSKDSNQYSNKIFDGLFKISILFGVGLLLIMRPFLRIYVGTEFYSSWKYSTFLIIGFIFMTLGGFVATIYTVQKDSVGFVKSAFIGAFVNLLLNFILIPTIGIYGAAVATMLSYISVFIYRIYDTKKYQFIRVHKKENYVGIFILCCSVAFNYIKSNISYILLLFNLLIIIILYRHFIVVFISQFKLKGMKKNEQ